MELIEDTKFYIENNPEEKIIEFVILYGENKELVKTSSASVGIKFEDLGFGFGIISIPATDFMNIEKIKGVQYIELPKVFTTNDMQSMNTSCVSQAWSSYGLTGKGIVIGFVDTGIDYKHPVFMDKNNKTRIKCIYNLANGEIYDEATINKALSSDDPDSIVPLTDFIGHGTAVASVAAGGGNVGREHYGVAYEASIIMVKTTGEGDFKSALSTQLLRGLKFLIDKSNELEMPLVVNISLSSNDGAHDGRSLVERYIGQYAQIQRVVVVIAAGNEGAAGHHYSADITGQKDVFFNVAGGEKSITLQLYKPILTDISIELVAPDGTSSDVIDIKVGVRRKEIKGHKIVVYFSGPKPFNRDGEIVISIIAQGQEVQIGQWILKVYNPTDYRGYFDIWLPVSEALNPKTKFLQPDPFNTLGIPATVDPVIAVGSYNANANNYSYFSGRGVERVNRIVKPDLLAPGENIECAMVGGFFGPETGTSFAAPHVAGSCALLLEWGIIKGNDPFLFGQKVKYYLVKGARRVRNLGIYPSKNVGFGYLCTSMALNLAIKDREDVTSSEKVLRNLQESEDLVKKNKKNRINEKVVDGKQESIDINKIVPNVDNANNVNEKTADMVNEKDKTQMNEKAPIEKKVTINNIEAKKDGVKENNICYVDDKKKPVQSTTKQYYFKEGYTDYLIQYNGDLIKAVEAINDVASAYILDESYALLSVKEDRKADAINLDEVIYVDINGVYTLAGLSPTDASNAINFEYNPYFNLTGSGTMIGIVDTGIDFLNDEFIRENNTTNIYRIWDQSLSDTTKTGKSMGLGVEYTEEDINQALRLKAEGKDPYTIVESKDINGHGTAMAGLIAGKGNNNSILGIATDTKIAMVKVKTADKAFKEGYGTTKATEYQYRNPDVILAVKYLYELAESVDEPMIIYIPLGTTVGGHEGTSLLERYIDKVSTSNGIFFVTSTGNEGDGENHTSGKIEKVGDRSTIELQVGEEQKDLFMTIYCNSPDKMGLSVASPSSDVFENINPKIKIGIDIHFIFEGTTMNIKSVDPSELTGDQVILISAKNLKPGIWSFTLIGEYIVDGTYDSWLLQKELIDPNTKFLTPTPNTTLTMPATSRTIISVGSYNQNNDSMMGLSGRGPTRKGRQSPVLVAGGYEAQVAGPNNIRRVMTGGSIAGAVIAGCCCQLVQWGMVDKNDITINPPKLRTYLMRGTKKRKGEVYPNPQFGYGIIDMNVLFANLKGLSLGATKGALSGMYSKTNRSIEQEYNKDINEHDEDGFYHGDLYIRLPKNNHS